MSRKKKGTIEGCVFCGAEDVPGASYNMGESEEWALCDLCAHVVYSSAPREDDRVVKSIMYAVNEILRVLRGVTTGEEP